MAKNLELTIGPNYIPDWGAWEAIREFIQNTLDANQCGYKMEIRRNPNGTLVLRNEGARLQYSDLVLGSSSKADGSFRGQYGEGFKLAMMVLCRMARDNGSTEPPIRIKTGSEMWRPTLVKSKNFGTEVLNIEVTSVQEDNGITVYIPNISDALWKIIQNRVMELSDHMKISSWYGDVLLDKPSQNQLYVKGLWICDLFTDLGQSAKFGYNINAAKVDRDRKMAQADSLTQGFRFLVADLLREKKITGSWLLDILLDDQSGNGFESNALMYCQNDIRDAICDAWKIKFGDAYAVTNSSSFNNVTALGGKAVEVSFNLAWIVSPVADSNKFVKEVSLTPKKIHSSEEIFKAEPLIRVCIDIAQEMLEAPFDQFTVDIVDFHTEDLHGTCSYAKKHICISKSKCEDLAEFMAVLIHEIAHLDGSEDLTKRHVDNIQKIGGMLVAHLVILD